MDSITDAPKVAATHGKNALSKVPKPVLIAGAVGTVAFVWYKKKHNVTATASTIPGNATPVADQGMTNQSYVPAAAQGGSISDPYGGYGNVGNYNTGLPLSPASPSGSSDTTVQAQLGDVSQLIGTLFPGGLPLGSGPLAVPLPGQAPSGYQAVSSTPQAAAPTGVVVAPPPPAPVVAVKRAPTVAGSKGSGGRTIIKMTHEKGKTCHYYNTAPKKVCF